MMIIKKYTAFIFLLMTTFFYGQHKEHDDKIKTLKIAFITEKLNFTSSEAQAFWPIYNAYQEKKFNLRDKERKNIHSKIKDADNLSEADAQKLLTELATIEAQKSMLENTFSKDIRKAISAKKTLLLMRTEYEFKRQLMRQFREKNENKKQ